MDSNWMRKMFDVVPDRYNLLNSILTFRCDRTWRREVLRVISVDENTRILDLCTGTGDLAIMLACKFSNAQVFAIDFSPKMIAFAKKRAFKSALRNVKIEEGDCTAMKFPAGYLDYVTISFGFRNLSYSADNLKRALSQIHRVLKEGGRFVVLETSQPANKFIRKIFHFYATIAVTGIGALISGRRAPYAYLGSSIIAFFDLNQMRSVVEAEGFIMRSVKPFMFGAILLWDFQKT